LPTGIDTVKGEVRMRKKGRRRYHQEHKNPKKRTTRTAARISRDRKEEGGTIEYIDSGGRFLDCGVLWERGGEE